MSRDGRSQPIQPFVFGSGATAALVPPDETVPPQAHAVPFIDPRRTLSLVAVGYGFVENIPANVTTPPPPVAVAFADERGRQRPTPDPIVLSGAQKFVFVAPTVTPPPSEFVPAQDDRRTSQPQPPVVISGVLAPQVAPTVTPPHPVVVGADRPRAALEPPDIARGPVDALPPTPDVAEPDDRRRRFQAPLPAVVLSGVLAPQVAPTVNPFEPIVVPLDQRGRSFVIPPATAQHGFVDPGPGAVGTTPPRSTNVDRADRRQLPEKPLSISGALAGLTPPPVTPPKPTLAEAEDKRRRAPAPDPVAQSGALRAPAAPAVNPPAPYVVPFDERRRFLAAIPPEVRRGFDAPPPPDPTVVTPDDQRGRRRPHDPTSISGARLGAFVPPVVPPGPYVVPLEERRRLLALLPPPTITHGPTPPPTVTPPPPGSHDRVDQRKRYLPLDPLILSGRLATEFPQAPAAVSIVDATTGPAVALLDGPQARVSVQDATGARVRVTDTTDAEAAVQDATGADVTIDDLEP